MAVLEKDRVAVRSVAAAFERDTVNIDVPPFSATDEDELDIVTFGFVGVELPLLADAARPIRPPNPIIVLLLNCFRKFCSTTSGEIILTADR